MRSQYYYGTFNYFGELLSAASCYSLYFCYAWRRQPGTRVLCRSFYLLSTGILLVFFFLITTKGHHTNCESHVCNESLNYFMRFTYCTIVIKNNQKQ